MNDPHGASTPASVDFQIEFQRTGAGETDYLVKARCQSAAATQDFVFPLEGEIDDIVARVEDAVYGPYAKGRRGVEVVQASSAEDDQSFLVDVGSRLFGAVFQGDVARLYHRVSDNPLRIRLSLDLRDDFQRALSRLPWESLIEEGRPHDVRFLSAAESSPIVRDVEIGDPLDKPAMSGPLNILLVTANPSDTQSLGLDDEERVIEETFGPLEAEGVVTVTRLRDASYQDLNSHLNQNRDYHVLHYMGHGDYEDGLGVLIFQGPDGRKEPVDGKTLALMLSQKTHQMRFMFMNACNTGVEGAGEAFGGVATSVLEVGIPAVIGMQFQIADDAAITFARGVYECIASHQPIDQAVSYARQNVIASEGGARRKTNFWLTPVLYMRSGEDGALFAAADRATPGPEAATEKATSPAPSEPPPGVDPEAPYVLWFSEHQGRLVLNWRVNVATGPGDRVALFDEPPTDPEAYVGGNYAYVAEGTQFLTDKPSGNGQYYIAYLRENDDFEFEIAQVYAPDEG